MSDYSQMKLKNIAVIACFCTVLNSLFFVIYNSSIEVICSKAQKEVRPSVI